MGCFLLGFFFGLELMRYGVLLCARGYGNGEQMGPGIERLAALFRGEDVE
ncbi:hypothetical protein [Roseibium sediminis]|nr:hypothetical protein [Roseibium sediminis]